MLPAKTMLPGIYTGVILIPPAIQADALADLGDLKVVVNNAATMIGASTNSSRNWGGWPWQKPQEMGTADVVQNITASILRANYNLGFNEKKWTTVTTTNGTKTDVNLTSIGIDQPYVDYINAIPNLSTALVALGRSWHREMNRPIHDAIQTLQNTITEFSSSLLQANLVDSKSTIRTIRASSTLEDAQIAWARPLNLPGSSRGGDGSIGAGDLGEAGTKEKGVVKREGESDLGRMMRRGWRGGVFPGEKGTEKERSPPEMPETGAATVVEITFDTAPAAAPVPVPANSATPKLNQVKTEAQAQGEEGQKVKRSPPRSRVDPQRLHFTHAELWGNSVQRRRIQDDQQDQETRSPTVLVPGADGVEEKEEFEKGENGMIFDGIHGPLVKGRIKVRPFLGD